MNNPSRFNKCYANPDPGLSCKKTRDIPFSFAPPMLTVANASKLLRSPTMQQRLNDTIEAGVSLFSKVVPSRVPVRFLTSPTAADLQASTDVAQLTTKAIKRMHDVVGGPQTVTDDPKMTKYAKASDIAYAYSYGDQEKLQSVLNDLEGFQLVRNLSGRNSVTLVNPKTKEAIIAYRGSDAQFANVETLTQNPERVLNVGDWYVNALTAAGNQRNTIRYAEAQQRFNNVKKEFPDFEIAVTGHSNGGGQSNFIAETNDVRGYHFNPAINPLQKPAGNTTKENIVYATEGDIVSLASRVSPHETSNYKITHVNPKVNTENDLLQLHDLDQFYTTGSATTKRVSTGRARLGIGNALAGGAAGEYLAYFTPESKAQKTYHMTELAAETLLLPEPVIGAHDFLTFMVPDLFPTVAEKNAIRKHLGIQPIKETNLNEVPQYDPLTEQIRQWTGRAKQDKELMAYEVQPSNRSLTSFEEQHLKQTNNSNSAPGIYTAYEQGNTYFYYVDNAGKEERVFKEIRNNDNGLPYTVYVSADGSEVNK